VVRDCNLAERRFFLKDPDPLRHKLLVDGP